MRKAKIFIINGIILTSSSLLIRGAGLIFNIYVANKVGQEAIGIFSLVMSVYSFAITFATSGVSLACTCIVSEEFAKNNFSKGITAVKTCIFFALILGLSASFLLFLLAPIISSNWLNGNVSNIPIYSISLGLPLISISAVIGGFLTSIGKSYKSAFAQCIELAIKIFATYFLLSFSITKGIDAICTSLIIGDVISELFSFLLNFIFYIIEKRKFKLSRSYNKELNIKIFKIAFPVAITSYIRSGLSSLKHFLIPIRLQASGLNYSLAISKTVPISHVGFNLKYKPLIIQIIVKIPINIYSIKLSFIIFGTIYLYTKTIINIYIIIPIIKKIGLYKNITLLYSNIPVKTIHIKKPAKLINVYFITFLNMFFIL